MVFSAFCKIQFCGALCFPYESLDIFDDARKLCGHTTSSSDTKKSSFISEAQSAKSCCGEIAESTVNKSTTEMWPDMSGSGCVCSLRQAACLDTPEGKRLADLLGHYVSASRDRQMELLDGMIQAWSATGSLQSASDYVLGTEAGQLDKEDLELLWRIQVLEKFHGSEFFPASVETGESRGTRNAETINAASSPSGVGTAVWEKQAALLHQGYQILRNAVYDRLLVQTRLRQFTSMIGFRLGDEGLEPNFSGMEQQLKDCYRQAPAETVEDLMELLRLAGPDMLAVGWDGQALLQSWLPEGGSAAH